jgi:Domain of unknown function (DUF4157)
MSASLPGSVAAKQPASKRATAASPAAASPFHAPAPIVPASFGNQSLLRNLASLPNRGSSLPSRLTRRFVGNQATLRRLQSMNILDSPTSRHESEAERASQGISKPSPPNSIGKPTPSAPQPNLAALPPVVQNGLSSPGGPLDSAIRPLMESHLGRSFADVRIHAGPEASLSARSISADAFTAGSHVVFGEGRYRPQTTGGQALLAHELTHVAQQADSQRPLIQRSPAADESLHKKKPAIVKIIAFEGALDKALAYRSDDPDPAPDDGAKHTPEELTLTGNPLPAGNYTLQQTSGGFYRVLGARPDAANKPLPAGAKEDLFRWINPYLDQKTQELKYVWAKTVEVEILASYYKKFLTGDKSGKGNPITALQLVQTAETLHQAGVSVDELRREEERRLDVWRLGRTDTPGDRVTWALDLAQQTLQGGDVARSTHGVLKFDLHRLETIPPGYVGIVVTYLTDPTDADNKLMISDQNNANRYTHPLWINFKNKEDLWDTLRRFKSGLKFEVDALAEAVLNATESEILRVQDLFVGNWGYVKNPAQLRNELAKASQDPEISSLRQKIHKEEDDRPSALRRAADTTESITSTVTRAVGPGAATMLLEHAPKTETEEYEEKLEADRDKLNQLVSEKTALKIGGLKGFSAERLFDTDTHTAQFQLSQVLAAGRNTVLSARRHLHSDSEFVWGADKIIKGEEEQLGITEGSVLDQIVQGIVSAELSKKSLWEQIWDIIDFLINFLPIPPPAGLVLRAISAGVSLGRAVDEYAKRGLLNQANLSAYVPSASGLASEFIETAAGTIIDVHASGVMHTEEDISRLRLERERVPESRKPPESKVPPPSERPSGETRIPDTEPPKTTGEFHGEESDIPPREGETREGAGGGGEKPPPPPPRPITVKEQSERIDELLKDRERLKSKIARHNANQRTHGDAAERLETLRGTKREPPDLDEKIRTEESKYQDARNEEVASQKEAARVDGELEEIRKQAVIPRTWEEHQLSVFQRQIAENQGALVGHEITLDVRNLVTGDEVRIRIDVAVYKNDELTLIDAKFSETGDAMTRKIGYQPQQKIAYPWISDGLVEVIPEGDNAVKMGLRPGEPIRRISPHIEIHVNSPEGIRVRDYRDTI